MTSLWRNVSVNVVANSNWSCLLISAPKIHWRVEPSASRRSGRFNKMLGALWALHVSQQRLYENWPQMLENEQWPLNNSPNLNGMEIACPASDTRRYFETVSELKIALEKICDIFPQVQLIRLSRVLQIVWQEYVNGNGRHSKHFSTQKSVRTFGVGTVLNSWDNFNNVSTAKLPWLKAA